MVQPTLRSVPAVLALSALCACQGGFASQSASPNQTSALPVTNASRPDTTSMLGCPYPSGNVYQTSILNAAPISNSYKYITAVMAAPGGSGGFQAWVNTQDINSANNSTPTLTVRSSNSYDHPYSPVPWTSSFFIEKDGDRHSEVLNTQSCQYYEAYSTVYNGSYLTVYNNEHIDLTKPFVQPTSGALSTATGIPLGLLAVRPEELAAGVVTHAIGWDAVSGSMNGVAGAACVSPAGKRNCTDGNKYRGPVGDLPMPYGSHARLKSSFNISGFSREAKIVATAMQQYGLYVYDTGCCNAIIIEQDSTGKPVWTSQDNNNLKTITPADFDIVAPPN
ncbi:MAG TPA: hypothetical protein VGK84_10410 [Candidatus Tumulicola sp.]